MLTFNEDTRVKVPATIQFLRLNYNYQSLKTDDIDIDFNTKIFVNRFKPALEIINSRKFTYDEIKAIVTDIHNVLKNNDLGKEFYNWLIDPKDKVKLIDFGASVGAEGGKGHVDIPVGTKGYAAPEQFVRGGTIDMRTDMYGFGAVMLYMLTGQSPSGAGGNWFRVLADGTAISKSLKTVLSRCVQPDPNRRYRCFEEIERDMENPESVLVSHKKTEFRILRSDLRF